MRRYKVFRLRPEDDAEDPAVFGYPPRHNPWVVEIFVDGRITGRRGCWNRVEDAWRAIEEREKEIAAHG